MVLGKELDRLPFLRSGPRTVLQSDVVLLQTPQESKYSIEMHGGVLYIPFAQAMMFGEHNRPEIVQPIGIFPVFEHLDVQHPDACLQHIRHNLKFLLCAPEAQYDQIAMRGAVRGIGQDCIRNQGRIRLQGLQGGLGLVFDEKPHDGWAVRAALGGGVLFVV